MTVYHSDTFPWYHVAFYSLCLCFVIRNVLNDSVLWSVHLKLTTTEPQLFYHVL